MELINKQIKYNTHIVKDNKMKMICLVFAFCIMASMSYAEEETLKIYVADMKEQKNINHPCPDECQ